MDYGAQYGQMHEAQKRFPGFSLGAYVEQIGMLIERHEITPGDHRLLDYGCGKGMQYLARRYHERWPGAILPHCYDIGVQQLAAKPEGRFEGVICTDVLEHIERGDVPTILGELIGYTAERGFLFLGIACRPSRKRLPDGRNVHLTVESPDWWIERLRLGLSMLDRGDINIQAAFDVGPGYSIQWWHG